MNIQNSVICGLSDWLYLQGGSNSLMEYHTGAKQLSEEEIESWRKTLQYRHEWHQARNIKYLQVFAPNKICVYPEFYPEELTIVGDRPIIQLIKDCGHLFTYQLDYLLSKKSLYDLYHKTDTHWNKIGAFFAYQQIMESIGLPYYRQSLELEDLNIEIESHEMTGDLGGRLAPPKTNLASTATVKSSQSRKVFDNSIQNRGSVKKFKNEGSVVGKLIIFGDSFSNNLVRFFSESFEEVVFARAAYVDLNYVEKEKPDVVISHMIERFMIKIPDDMNSPHLEEYAKILGKI